MAACKELLENCNYAPAQLGNVLVLGLGKTGQAAARYCAAHLGHRVRSLSIAAGERTDTAERLLASLKPSVVQALFGDDAVAALAEGVPNKQFDLCIASPGISPQSSFFKTAKAYTHEVISEVEFAWRESAKDSLWVAITGTNGKTTTTACTATLLKTAGLRARAVGNIGSVCLDAVAEGTTEVYVAEVSSYQLALTHRFAPNVAAIINITPDHLAWHGTFEAYREAKLKVLENLSAPSLVPAASSTDASLPAAPSSAPAASSPAVALLNATDPEVRACIKSLRAQTPEERGFSYIPVGTAQGVDDDMRLRCGSESAAFVAPDGYLTVAFQGRTHRLVCADELAMPGEHNVINALIAAGIALAVGVEDDACIAQTLRTFAPLEHRMEPCGSVAGVTCYNDSKATNVDATCAAIKAFGTTPLVVLLGGDDKNTDLTTLVAAIHAHAHAVVCFGAAAQRFVAAFEQAHNKAPSKFCVKQAQGVKEALEVALALALPGEAVLLSPACASFDEFGSFEERGRFFKDCVAALRIQKGS